MSVPIVIHLVFVLLYLLSYSLKYENIVSTNLPNYRHGVKVYRVYGLFTVHIYSVLFQVLLYLEFL